MIRIIFYPNTRQWEGGGGVSRVVIRGSLLDHSWTILDHFSRCTFNLCANGLVDLWIIFWKLNCWNN